MQDLSDRQLQSKYLMACAENLQWLLDSSRVEGDRLSIEGWAITLSGEPEQARFLLNGIPFEDVRYPIPSPDIGEIFWDIPNAQNARFVCQTPIKWDSACPDWFA